MASDQDTLAALALAGANKTKSAYWRATCPFCPNLVGKQDKRWSMWIHVHSGFYGCYRCGTKGKIKKVPEHILEGVDTDAEKLTSFDPPESFTLLADDSSTGLKRARRYLKKRGIKRETCRQAKVGACLFGKFCYRVVVPILAPDGETWLGFSARDWTNKSPLRYRYPPGMNRREIVYNPVAITRETDTPLLVVEGVFDALPYWPDVVAVLGKPSEPQVEMLKEATRPISVVLDGDEHDRGWALAQQLKFFGKTAGNVRLPPKTDPNDVDPQWLKEAARRSISE